MQSNKEFGERLKNLRKEHGKTQLDVAQQLGITPQAVSKWESGASLPDCFNLQSLSELYGITLDTLLQIRNTGTAEELGRKSGVMVQEYLHAHPDTPLFSLLSTLWNYILAAAACQEPADSIRIMLPEGLGLSDRRGISCLLTDSCDTGKVGQQEWELLQNMTSPSGYRLLSLLHTHVPVSKQTLFSETGLDTESFQSLLLLFLENRIIEYVTCPDSTAGYRLHPHAGIAASLVLAAGSLLATPAGAIQDLSLLK